MEDFLGWVLIILGIAFMVVGLVQGRRDVQEARVLRGQGVGLSGLPWGDIILELIKGGLGMVAVRLLLLLLGLDLTDIAYPFGGTEGGTTE